MSLAFSAALAKHFETALVGTGYRNRQTLGKKVVARVTSSDFDLIGLAAETNDVMSRMTSVFGIGESVKVIENQNG